MDKLTDLGLRIDENEKLRIISDETERSSTEISSKTKLLISDLSQLEERLNKVIELLRVLDQSTKELRIHDLAAKIIKLQNK